MNISATLEIMTYHYVCSNTSLMEQVDPKIFIKPEIRILYRLVKTFYTNYGVVPNLQSMEQMREIISEDNEVHNLSPAKPAEENIKDFLAFAEIINTHPMEKYEPVYLKNTVEANLMCRKLETGLQTAIDYYQKQNVSPNNVAEIVSQVQSIFMQGTVINLYQERPLDFWKGESHIQTSKAELIDTGWPTMNTFLNGGFERKTLTHLWGAPNIGKSLFLGTIGKNVSVAGKNVFIGSLEMDTRKYTKRMGAAMLGIPIADYSKDKDPRFFYEKLREFREKNTDGFNTIVPGALFIQRFTHASPATITAAADKLAKELGLNWDLVIYDYLGELESKDGSFGLDNMYALHKINNAELFDHAVQYNWAALTAHQVTADFFDAQDMNMKASAESRGISHRTDNIFGILQDPVMYAAGKFYLKNLKARDNEYKNHFMRLNIDWKTMNLTDDKHMVKPGDNMLI